MVIKGIKDILITCQKSCANHQKLVKNLLNIYLKSDFEEFLKDFTHYLKFILIHGEKEPVVERSLNFVSRFATSVKTETENQPEETASEDLDDVDPLLVFVFNFLLKSHNANSPAVRYRVCYLINKLLNSMGEQASIDDDLFSTIYDTMLQRLKDKKPAIRVQAILALARLQDPTNKECPVIKAYRYHLTMDPESNVRKAVLSNIAITFQTLPDVLERIRDVRDFVRRQAYIILAQKVHIRSFTIAQRVMLVADGLKDRSQSVRLAVKKNLLQAWLRLVDGKILDLLACLDVETSTESSELALENMFEDVPYSTLLENFTVLNKSRLVDFADLKPESAFCWKCLAKHLKKEKAFEHLDEILPDLSTFCEYINEYMHMEVPTDIDPQETAMKCMQKEFIVQQFLSITLVFDLSDEVGRKNLGLLTRSLLLNATLGESFIPTLCNLLKNLYAENPRMNNVAEIISDLREVEVELQDEAVEEPMQLEMSEDQQRKHKLKIAKNSVKIFQLREELEECVRSLNLERAQELKTSLKELEELQQLLTAEATKMTMPTNKQERDDILETRDDEANLSNEPEVLTRCLMILSQTLSSSDITILSSTIRSMHDNLILPCLSSEIPAVRKNAIQALANVCLISADLTKQHILLFIRISQIDTEEIQVVALKAVFDFLHLYGLGEFFTVAESIFSVPGFTIEDSSPSVDISASHSLALGNVIGSISKMLDSDSTEIRTLVAEGFCKLLLSSRIASPKLFAHLLIMWFNPVTEEDYLLRHMLGVFFPLYAAGGADNADIICQAVIPIVHTIFDAPPRSPISDIDIKDVCKFLVSITNPRIVCSNNKNSANVHDTLVFSLCAEVLAYSDRGYVKYLCQVMNELSLTPNNYPTLKQVDALCDKMLKSLVRDRPSANSIERFQKSKIKKLLINAPMDEIKEEKTNEQEIPDDSEKTREKTISKRKRTLFNSTDVALELCENVSETEDNIFSGAEDVKEPKNGVFTAEIPCISIKLASDPEESTSIDVSSIESASQESDLNTTSVAESSDLSSNTVVEAETSPPTKQVHPRRSSRKSKSPSLTVKRVRKRNCISPSTGTPMVSPATKKKKRISKNDSPNVSSQSREKVKRWKTATPVSTQRTMSTRSAKKGAMTSNSQISESSSPATTVSSQNSFSSRATGEKKRKSSNTSSKDSSSQESVRKSLRLSRSATKKGNK